MVHSVRKAFNLQITQKSFSYFHGRVKKKHWSEMGKLSMLILETPTPQNGQTHSDNSLVNCR